MADDDAGVAAAKVEELQRSPSRGRSDDVPLEPTAGGEEHEVNRRPPLRASGMQLSV